MKLCVVGTGYVGLVTGTCFADSGNDVTCVDIDPAKVASLKRGEVPIYEPGLGEMIEHNVAEGRLHFTTDLADGLDGAQVVFICVGTPQRHDGSANLDALFAVAGSIREHAADRKLVVVKSTVPVGTNARVREILNGDDAEVVHGVGSNPEFLKEGHAIEDFAKPDRVVVGSHDDDLIEALRTLHAPFLRSGHPYLSMAPESSEMTKYAANCLLATKISFINEMAGLCEALGADINAVRHGIGHDQRIGFQFLFPGAGYGGSCFPKDVRAMASLAKDRDVPTQILDAVDEVNNRQKHTLFAKVKEALGADLNGKRVAVWGLAFKPRTDDIREAPALVLIDSLLEAGAEVVAYDPKAVANVRADYGDRIGYAGQPMEALDDAEALVIATEWQEFRTPNFARMKDLLARPLVIDGRNLYEPSKMAQRGFEYHSIGRSPVRPGDEAVRAPFAESVPVTG